jgi:hypothetical protein
MMTTLRMAIALAAIALSSLAEAHGPVARAEPCNEASARAPVAAPARAQAARDLTLALIERADAHGRSTLKAASHAALLDAARERRAYLAALAPHDPAEVLLVAVPAEILGRLPDDVHALVEETVEATGDL